MKMKNKAQKIKGYYFKFLKSMLRDIPIKSEVTCTVFKRFQCFVKQVYKLDVSFEDVLNLNDELRGEGKVEEHGGLISIL
ncbi:TPA_asm: hypothetical protein [Altiarchaeum virus]|nr:MAG: hypothetical protein BWK75_06450 [Candidatus Altiarchaeales archaeon A3]DAZ85552.1 TPA_asm: hypothetical protein [Altiarchaeum virus]